MAVRRLGADEQLVAAPRKVRPLRDDEQLVEPKPDMVASAPVPVTEGPAGVVPTQYQEGPPLTKRATPKTLAQGASDVYGAAKGVGDVALTMGSGMVSEPVAGIAGTLDLLHGGPNAGQRATNTINKVREGMTYQPRTREGKAILDTLGKPFEALERGAGAAGGATLDATGSPALATAVDTAIQSIPMFAGVKRPHPSRRADIARIKGEADAVDLNMNANSLTQKDTLADAADNMTPSAKGQGMGDLQAAMKQARTVARDAKNAQYAAAKKTAAGVPVERAVELPGVMRQVTKDFITDDMKVVQKMLGDLDAIDELPKGSTVKLNALERWRQKVNRNRPSRVADEAQNSALDVMQAQLDDWVDTQFNADMISGSPEAVESWRQARAANKDYRARFKDTKVIRDLVEQEAQPETVKNWILGANAVGAKSEAGAVVRRIKNELGEDSPHVAALRQEVLLDVLDPLLQPEPSLKNFVRNYDKFVKKNPSLAKELFPESRNALRSLRDFAEAVKSRPGAALSELPGASRILGVAAFGHGIARGSLRVKTATGVIQQLTRAAAKTPKRRMMGNLLGYDPYAPVLGAGAGATLGAAQTLGDQGGQQDKPTTIRIREGRGGNSP